MDTDFTHRYLKLLQLGRTLVAYNEVAVLIWLLKITLLSIKYTKENKNV